MALATQTETPSQQMAIWHSLDEAPSGGLRVWLLTNAPSPYQSELLSAISDQEKIELEVRFMLAGSPAGQAAERRYASRVMRSLMPRFFREELHVHPRAVWECGFSQRDVFVLSGLYTSLTFLLCSCLLALRGVPWIVWFERPHPGRQESDGWSLRQFVRRPIRATMHGIQRAILRSASRVLCIGTAAKDAYARLGVPEDRLDVLPYCCDVDRYQDVTPSAVETVRERHQLHGKTVFLFSGQMIERKGVDTALAAFAQVAEGHQDVTLILLGTGPLRERYEASVPPSLRSCVHFPGHVPQPELPAYFLAADVFVFPSRHDGWGVVVNEACAARLPVITTWQTGAAYDLVDDSRSGFILESDDITGFAKAMQHFLDHPLDRQSFGQRSRELVDVFSPQNGALRFQQVLIACRMS